MKIKLIIYLVLFLTSIILINSCSETTSPNNVKNYFPNTVGNYWVYESFDLDTTGNKVQSSRTIDSTVITSSWTLYGKQSDVYTHYIGVSSSEYYYYTENGKLYSTLAKVMPPKIPFPIDFTDAWVVIADPDSASWTMFIQQLNDKEVTLEGFSGKLNGNFTIKGVKGLKQAINTGEGQTTSVMSQEYKILYSFDGKFTPSSIPFPLDLKFTVTNHKWYGENIGLVLDRVDPESISISIYTYNIIGTEAGMLRYHVSQ